MTDVKFVRGALELRKEKYPVRNFLSELQMLLFFLCVGIVAPSFVPFERGDGTSFLVDSEEVVVTTLVAGRSNGFTADGLPREASVEDVVGLAYQQEKRELYFTQRNNLLRKVDVGTGFTTTIAGREDSAGLVDGVGPVVRFSQPRELDWITAAEDVLYICDQLNGVIRRANISNGNATVTTLGDPGISGSVDGLLQNSGFLLPIGINIDTEGQFAYVYQLNRVRRIDIPAEERNKHSQ
eukprot:jgi/Bigna1/145770/aug1.103_g20478